MFIDIFQHTPIWVWFLLAALIGLGVAQTFPRRRTLRNATTMPVIMIVLSFSGVVSAFVHQPVALVTWAMGVAAALAISKRIGAWSGVGWSDTDRLLIVPGSWIPLLLILAIFVTKFAVGTTLAINPGLAFAASFAAPVGFVYGAFSGIFLGRGVAVWRVAKQASFWSQQP